MRSKLLSVMLVAMTCLTVQRADAQTRYQDSIFASYTLDSVTYSTPYSLKMDIYQPAGDVQATRPAVILAHEGTFISGTRASDPTVVRLCKDLAHKGYVAISIDYRLEDNLLNFFNADSVVTEVMEAVGDGKAAIRYLYMDAATTNTYKIDTNNIFIGGNSAGAVLAMQAVYITSLSELPANFQAIVTTLGGLQGTSGNAGYSSNVKGVVCLAGGLDSVSWMGYCSKPVVAAQGSLDAVVPYTCADPNVGITVPLQLCGLGSLQPNITANTPYSSTLVFPGQGHVPWDTSAHMFFQVDTLVTGFLYNEVTPGAVASTCPIRTGIQQLYTAGIKLYPNPATNLLNIESSQFISTISLTDEMGRIVAQVSDINSLSYQMNTSRLSTGVYFIRVEGGEGQVAAVGRITIE